MGKIGLIMSVGLIGFEQVPPQNVEAEQMVLGALLVDREVIPLVMGILEQKIFIGRVMADLPSGNRAFNRKPGGCGFCGGRIRPAKGLENVGVFLIWPFFLPVCPSASAEHHATIVKEKSLP